jgi:hypothetical protein
MTMTMAMAKTKAKAMMNACKWYLPLPFVTSGAIPQWMGCAKEESWKLLYFRRD